MQCPVCKDKTLVMSERQGIEIDYCPGCRGVWLDRGELDKILERSVPERAVSPAPVAAPQHAHQTAPRPQHDDYYRQKRRKSFLEELFD